MEHAPLKTLSSEELKQKIRQIVGGDGEIAGGDGEIAGGDDLEKLTAERKKIKDDGFVVESDSDSPLVVDKDGGCNTCQGGEIAGSDDGEEGSDSDSDSGSLEKEPESDDEPLVVDVKKEKIAKKLMEKVVENSNVPIVAESDDEIAEGDDETSEVEGGFSEDLLFGGEMVGDLHFDSVTGGYDFDGGWDSLFEVGNSLTYVV